MQDERLMVWGEKVHLRAQFAQKRMQEEVADRIAVLTNDTCQVEIANTRAGREDERSPAKRDVFQGFVAPEQLFAGLRVSQILHRTREFQDRVQKDRRGRTQNGFVNLLFERHLGSVLL